MSLGNRGPGSPSKRRRWAFRPRSESLEGRRLLATTLDLATIQSAPLGVEMVGQNNSGATNQVTGAGYTVTDVGDLTGSGFDDYAVAADGLTAPTLGNNPTFTGTSTVYLIFGSQSVSSSTAQDYAAIVANQRAGDLGQLGGIGTPPATAQVNPTVTQPAAPALPLVGYNFNGLTLTTGAAPQSGLGFSIAALGDINGDGHDDFAIGAPNDTGGGKVYIIYGSTSLASLASGTTQAPKLIDLEPTGGGTGGLVTAGVKVVTLFDSQTGSAGAAAGASGLQFGYSVAGLGNYINFGTTAKDVGVGAPGFNGDQGAAFAISGLGLNSDASGANIDVSTLVTANGTGIEYDSGIVAERAGTSVSTAGDFDGARSAVGNSVIDDFLIGAPGSNLAYLVYGDQQVAKTNGISDSTTGNVYQLSGVPASGPNLSIGAPQDPTNPSNVPLEGLIFPAPPSGAQSFGFSVSTAGDYNGDGLGDVIIGSPGSNTTAATIYYGVGLFTPAPNLTIVPFPSTHITGKYTPGTIQTATTGVSVVVPPPLAYTNLMGSTTDMAGYSVSYVGDLTGQGLNGVLIGAPGTKNNQGEVYAIPGNYLTPSLPDNASFPASVELQTAITSTTYAGFGLTLSNSITNGTPATAPYLGTTVSGRSPLVNSQQFTLDRDAIPDIFTGAPGYNPPDPATGGTTSSRLMAGASFALEGTFLPQTPPSDVVVTAAGIGTNSPTGPFSIATTPNNLTIFIYPTAAANGLPAFDPATDITSPTTLIINGVTFTNVTLTPVTNPAGAVSFVIDRSLLSLTAGTTINFTIQGKTNAGTVFIARATGVAITAGGGGASGGGGAGIVGPTAATILAPPIFTGNDAGLPFPPVSSLEHLTSYQPLPVQIAYQQFLPQPGFLAREEVYTHPSKAKGAHQAPRGTVLYVAAIGRKSLNQYTKKNTLPHAVLSKTKFQYGKTITFTHKVKVIPRSQQTEKFSA